MPNQAVNHYRRTLLKGIGAATLLSPLASIPSFAAAPRRLYVDGLSFLPDDLADVTASKLDAYLCDISAIETIEQADGTQNYKRTYKACMESIKQAAKRVSDHPDILLQGLRGRDIQRARDSQRTFYRTGHLELLSSVAVAEQLVDRRHRIPVVRQRLLAKSGAKPLFGDRSTRYGGSATRSRERD